METHFIIQNTYSLSDQPTQEEEEEEDDDPYHDHHLGELLLLKLAIWVISTLTISQLPQLLANLISTLFITPIFFLFSMACHTVHRADQIKHQAQTIVQAVLGRVPWGTWVVLRRLGLGVLGAVNVGLVLVALMILAVVVGVGLVRVWADEEPVVLKEKVYFDYTDVYPTAVVELGGGGGWEGKRKRVVPVGHRLVVGLELVLPDSDFNRRVGLFQVTAEVMSESGMVLARSSQPCTLHFQSLPIRLIHTFISAIPILLGISSENQKISLTILQFKEGKQKTVAIRTKLVPKAGTSALPEIYSAEIFLNSQLPWRKELVHNWKWTFYVWASINMYIVFLVIVLCCCRNMLFPRTEVLSINVNGGGNGQRDWKTVEGDQKGIYDRRSRWEPSRRRRRKRKELLDLEHEHFDETVFGHSSGIASTSEEASEVLDFSGFTDVESVCLDG